MNPYRTLGVKKKSTDQEIKDAYKELAKKFHPDKKGGDEEKFKKINEAYGILKDAQQRDFFDKTGTTPNSKDSQAINEIVNLFKILISQQAQADADVKIELVSKRIKDDISKTSITLLDMRRVENNIVGQTKNVGMKKKKKPNCYQMAINLLLEELGTQIKQQESILKRLNAIKKIADNYETLFNGKSRKYLVEDRRMQSYTTVIVQTRS